MTTGIYEIINRKNNYKYIGYAKNIEQRWKHHIYNLNKNTHDNGYLQNAWNKYGEKNFSFSIIEECKENKLIKKEKYYIKKLKTVRPNGYNLSEGGLGNTGWKPSEETLLKKSNSVLGNKNPMWGRKHSEKTRILFSKQRRGTKNGIGNKNNLGKIKKIQKFY